MKAMILAAGIGTRLYPLTLTLPKPMAPVCNRPVMEHIINELKEHGFDEFICNLHNMPQNIEEYFGDGSRFGVSIRYSHEPELKGTAGGVKKIEDEFNDTFMVIGGDDLSNINISDVVKFHKEKGAIATIGLSYKEDVEHYGVVVTDDEGHIKEFQEKPNREDAKSHWVNNGIYLFEPEVFKFIPKDTFYDFGSELFPLLKNRGEPFFGCHCKGYWKDIGNLEEYRRAHFDCLEHRVEVKLPGREVKPRIWVENDTFIDEDAEIQGPVIIGKNCKILKGAKIIGPAAIGKFNILEEGVVINKSVIWNYNHIKSGVELEGCLVGSECLMQPGTKYKDAAISNGMDHIFEEFPGKGKYKVPA